MGMKTIEIPEDLYNAIQRLKEVFKEMTGQSVEKDEDVIAILVVGFIDSLSQGNNPEESSEEGEPEIA